MHHSFEIDNPKFSYPDGHSALNGISLHIEPCEKVALVGPNGAGKSTLILHLNGILEGQGGDVCVAGLPVIKANFGKVRARVGLVFQNPDDQLFSPTVYEDVDTPLADPETVFPIVLIAVVSGGVNFGAGRDVSIGRDGLI